MLKVMWVTKTKLLWCEIMLLVEIPYLKKKCGCYRIFLIHTYIIYPKLGFK